jgi:putative ABC transport system permease protein
MKHAVLIKLELFQMPILPTQSLSTKPFMIRNYLKTAWRTLWKNGQASAINILGLALGIAVFLLIIQYVAAEWSANRFHKNFNQLYRVSVLDKQGKAQHILPPGYAPLLKDKIPRDRKLCAHCQ